MDEELETPSRRLLHHVVASALLFEVMVTENDLAAWVDGVEGMDQSRRKKPNEETNAYSRIERAREKSYSYSTFRLSKKET